MVNVMEDTCTPYMQDDVIERSLLTEVWLLTFYFGHETLRTRADYKTSVDHLSINREILKERK